jgi:hypothetical protein
MAGRIIPHLLPPGKAIPGFFVQNTRTPPDLSERAPCLLKTTRAAPPGSALASRMEFREESFAQLTPFFDRRVPLVRP